MRRRLEPAEMWFVRRMLRIPGTARRTKEEVLRRGASEKRIDGDHNRKQSVFVAHKLRGKGLEKECLLVMIDGRRGKQRLKFTDGIIDVTGCAIVVDVLTLAEDWSLWRSVTTYANLLDTALR